jgi:electron transport complex protein RnfA
VERLYSLCPLASIVTWPIYKYLLEPNKLGYLQTIAFILVIAALVQLVEIILKKFMPPLYKSLGVFLPLITTNCAVLGVTILNIDKEYTYITSIGHAVGAGIGFGLALILFAGIREKLESCDVPEAFKGLPIALVSAALVSLTFFGFQGLFG